MNKLDYKESITGHFGVEEKFLNTKELPELGGGLMSEFMITSYALEETDTTLYYKNVADNYTSGAEIHMIFKTACEYLASVIRKEREIDMELLNGLLKGSSKYCPEPIVKYKGEKPFSESIGLLLEVKVGEKLVMSVTYNSLSFDDTAITLESYKPFSMSKEGKLPQHTLAISDPDITMQPTLDAGDGDVVVIFMSEINPVLALRIMTIPLGEIIKLLSRPYDCSLSDLIHTELPKVDDNYILRGAVVTLHNMVSYNINKSRGRYD
ncbi:MAG: hypothetical protein ACRC92_04170 [Peptostreptococcaceae bacterium]